MTEEATNLQPEFNEVSPSGHTGALMIDMQLGCIARMEPVDAQRYLDKMGETVKELREKNIPVTWVTIGDKNKLHKPKTNASSQNRDSAELEAMNFFGVSEDFKGVNEEAFKEFIEEHGPREDEAVYCKYFKSALTMPEDAEGKPGYQKVLGNETDRDYDEIVKSAFEDRSSLDAYLNEEGVQELILAGAVSGHCVSETAIAGAIKGKDMSVLTDGVIGWGKDEDGRHEGYKGYDYSTAQLEWAGTSVEGPDPGEWHKEQMESVRRKILKDATNEKANEREYSSGDINAIKKKIRFTSTKALLSSKRPQAKKRLTGEVPSVFDDNMHGEERRSISEKSIDQRRTGFKT